MVTEADLGLLPYNIWDTAICGNTMETPLCFTMMTKKIYTPSTTLRTNGANVLSFRIEKNSLLVGSEESVLSINLISQSSSSTWWFSLRKCGSNFVWEYHLLMQSFVNIYNCSILDGICQLLTQHTVSHILYKK